MTAGDVQAVVDIETEAFSTPWQAETFEGLIGREGIELLVMESAGGEVLGYAVLWCIMDQGELANIAVHPEQRGRGLGARLLEEVVAVCRARGVTSLYLEVRASNQGAIDLYQGFGFRDVGRRRDYYQRPTEDARIMELVLD
jgi:ribosomal-protein-alanine N-acetyltransferase